MAVVLPFLGAVGMGLAKGAAAAGGAIASGAGAAAGGLGTMAQGIGSLSPSTVAGGAQQLAGGVGQIAQAPMKLAEPALQGGYESVAGHFRPSSGTVPGEWGAGEGAAPAGEGGFRPPWSVARDEAGTPYGADVLRRGKFKRNLFKTAAEMAEGYGQRNGGGGSGGDATAPTGGSSDGLEAGQPMIESEPNPPLSPYVAGGAAYQPWWNRRGRFGPMGEYMP